ncbi:MAG: Hsp33 family molecular chaperone HslO [Bacillota bacterium]
MGDYLIKVVGARQEVRAFAAVTTEAAEEARRRHGTWPVATAALGRTLTAALLLGANLKGEYILTVRVLGDGPLGGIVATAGALGEVRGYVQEPHVDLPADQPSKLPVGKAVGKGFIYVTRDLGLKEPFTGSARLVSGEIAEDLANYLTVSEQFPSAVSLGVRVSPEGRVTAAGGIMVNLMPDASEETASRLEANLKAMPPISTLIEEGKSPEDILAMVFQGMDMEILSKMPVAFRCKCGRERVGELLLSLGEDELEKIYLADEATTVTCHFCGEAYTFDRSELGRLLEQLKTGGKEE